MADPLSSLIRPTAGPQLPAFERFAPPPPDNVAAAELAARTAPGDVVIDVHGRGGWIARGAISALRRVYSFESTALTRLLAEVVLRPPDLRHFDAGLSTVATHPRGEVELKRALETLYTSRCPTCGRPVIVEEFIWEAGANFPERKVFRCSFCREQVRGNDARVVEVDDGDRRALAEIGDRPSAWATLRSRFPVILGGEMLPDELLGLYTPRALVAIEAIVERLETDLRAAPVAAGLKLGLVHGLLAASRLNGYPGRVAALRIRHGHVQEPTSRYWRERNVWLAFEEGCREVRSFITRVEAGAGSFQPRPGEDLEALIDGTANVVLRTGPAFRPGNEPQFSSRRPVLPGRLDPRSRVRLVLTQPPLRWTVENASFAYLATALVEGRAAATELPLEWIFGPPPSNDRGREATGLRRSLLAVRPVLARDAKAVVILDRGGASGLVAGVLGGVGAGFRLSAALLAELGNQIGGVLEFDLGQGGDQTEGHPELDNLRRADPDQPFALADVEQAVSQVAVTVLQARGEPAGGERLLGEVLIGLDRLGHLRRLVGTQTFGESEAATGGSGEAPGPDLNGDRVPPGLPVGAPGARSGPDASAGLEAADDRVDGDVARSNRNRASAAGQDGAAADPAADPAAHPSADPGADPMPESAVARGEVGALRDGDSAAATRPPEWALGAASATDHVRLLMEIVMGELRRADHPRLVEVESGRWWLRSTRDLDQARPPLSDRLEWAAFGLVSTSQGMDEQTFFERIAGMFSGHDTPDSDLVRAVLDSYRDPESAQVRLRPQDGLSDRHVEHGELVGLLVDYGHRLGLRAHVSPRERRRAFGNGTVGDLLSDEEQRAYMPLVAGGDPQTLESMDCIWYLRGKATFLFEVEWTAMLTDALLRRGPRIPVSDTVIRFLVLPPERTELVRFKLARSPLLRSALDEQNWHILKSDHLRRLVARDEAGLDQLAPILGLDPEIEREAEQLALFG